MSTSFYHHQGKKKSKFRSQMISIHKRIWALMYSVSFAWDSRVACVKLLKRMNIGPRSVVQWKGKKTRRKKVTLCTDTTVIFIYIFIIYLNVCLLYWSHTLRPPPYGVLKTILLLFFIPPDQCVSSILSCCKSVFGEMFLLCASHCSVRFVSAVSFSLLANQMTLVCSNFIRAACNKT